MIIKILQVEIGAYDDFTDTIYEFWITGELKSGIIIRIYDAYSFDLRGYVGQKVNCLIDIEMIKNIYLEDIVISNKDTKILISGIFHSNYLLDPKWIELDNSLKDTSYQALQTRDGIFLVEPSELKKYNLNEEEFIYLDIIRLDLIAWRPIK